MPFIGLFWNYYIKKYFLHNGVLSFIWFSCLVSWYMWKFSRVFIIYPFFVCKIFMFSLIVPNTCPLSSRCCANLDEPYPFFKCFWCSLYLMWNDLSVCPMYFYGTLSNLIGRPRFFLNLSFCVIRKLNKKLYGIMQKCPAHKCKIIVAIHYTVGYNDKRYSVLFMTFVPQPFYFLYKI